MLAAITRFEEPALDAVYNDALALYPVDLVTERLIAPLLARLGERWQDHTGDVAEEHFFSAYLRNKLGARLHHQNPRGPRAGLVAACLPGERHEVGLLLFCLSAASQGHRLVLLGADMPLEGLPDTVRRSGSNAIVLSTTTGPAPDLLRHQLPRLVQAAGVPVCLGGQGAIRHRREIQAAGAVCLGAGISDGLRHLQDLLRGERAARKPA
jgi:hypothetical protein